eukprot:scaffold238567_cov19-Tisochrysis_lutea.AAC.2
MMHVSWARELTSTSMRERKRTGYTRCYVGACVLSSDDYERPILWFSQLSQLLLPDQSLAQAPARAVCWKASVPMCACLAPASAAFQKASDVCLFGTGTRKRFGDESEEEEEEVPGGAGWGGAAGGRRRSGSSAKRQRSSLQVRCGYACEGAGAMLWVSQWCKVNHSFTHALAYTYTFVGQLSSTGARQGERMRFLVHSRMQGLPSHANWKEAARSVVAALMKEPCAELFLEPVDEEVRKAGPPN